MSTIDPVGSTAMINLPREIEKQAATENDFTAFLGDALMAAQKTQFQADQAMENLATGDAASIHEVMTVMEEADITMRMVVQMRNKVVEAYQEIMRMQV